jgi:hypothetical protein
MFHFLIKRDQLSKSCTKVLQKYENTNLFFNFIFQIDFFMVFNMLIKKKLHIPPTTSKQAFQLLNYNK